MKKRKRYETFLSKVELLDTMEPYERSKIADVIKTRDYKKGEYIIREGEKGNTFYFIEKGEAVASKMIKGIHYSFVVDFVFRQIRNRIYI